MLQVLYVRLVALYTSKVAEYAFLDSTMETSSNQLAARAVLSEDQREETESDSADEDNDESDGAVVESNVHIQEEAVDVEDSGKFYVQRLINSEYKRSGGSTTGHEDI